MNRNWKSWSRKLGLASCLAMGGAIATSFDSALAQITPNNTLGSESSVVTLQAAGSPIGSLNLSLLNPQGQVAAKTGLARIENVPRKEEANCLRQKAKAEFEALGNEGQHFIASDPEMSCNCTRPNGKPGRLTPQPQGRVPICRPCNAR